MIVLSNAVNSYKAEVTQKACQERGRAILPQLNAAVHVCTLVEIRRTLPVLHLQLVSVHEGDEWKCSRPPSRN